MKDHRFAALVRSLTHSRRAVVGALGLGALTRPGFIDARMHKRKKRKKHKKKIALNAFGCVNVGGFCTTREQCCSGICEGKQGKKSCRDHDGGSGCQAGLSEGCEGGPPSVSCMTSTGLEGGCDTTTGNAGYCGSGFVCADCRKDVDCQDLCGIAAAVCVRCPDCAGPSTIETACIGPSPGDCSGN